METDSPFLSTEGVITTSYSNFSDITASGAPSKAIGTVTLVAAILSAIGACTIILSYLVWPDIRTRSRTFLFFISVADLLVAIANAVGSSGASTPTFKVVVHHGWNSTNLTYGREPTDLSLCKAQAAWGTFGMLCSIFWSIAMAAYLYVQIVKDDHRLARIAFHVSAAVCTLVPLGVVSAALACGMLGWDSATVSVGWCWIRSGSDVGWKKQLLWRLLAGKAWEIPAYVIIPALYILIKRHISAATKIDNNPNGSSQFLLPNVVQTMTRTDRKLTWVPILFLLLHLWGTIRFFLELSKDLDGGTEYSSHHLQVLELLQGIGDSSQGTANCILFVLLTTKLRERLFFCFTRKKRRSEDFHTSVQASSGPLLLAENA